MSQRHISEQGYNLVKHFEGCRLRAYWDNGEFSIGYGHRGVPVGTIWTQARADTQLWVDLEFVQLSINEVNVPLNQNQVDALSSLIYNIGSGHWSESTVLRLLNEGNYKEGAEAIKMWDKVDGVVNKNLKQRRETEFELFNKET